jgi:hypothetical protein
MVLGKPYVNLRFVRCRTSFAVILRHKSQESRRFTVRALPTGHFTYGSSEPP